MLSFTHGTRGVAYKLADSQLTFYVCGEGRFTSSGVTDDCYNFLFHCSLVLFLLYIRSASSAIRTAMMMMIIILKEDGKGKVDVGVF